MDSRLRRAASVLLALAAAGCDGKPTPPAPAPRAGTQAPPAQAAAGEPQAPADERTTEAALDDEALLAVVYATAARDLPFPEMIRKLPPRVSRMRVGVRALHDHLLGVLEAPEDRQKLLAALDRVTAECTGGVDEKVLPRLVGQWKTWSPAQVEAERELAVRLTRTLDFIRAPDETEVTKIPAAFANLPPAPPGSPAAAGLAAVRAIHLALTGKPDDFPVPLDEAVGKARTAFDNIGWPGGLGVYFEIASARLERDGKVSLRSLTLGDRARDAFQASGDGVRAAMITADRAATARRNGLTGPPDKARGELDRAVKLYASVVEQLDTAGQRGAELLDALFARAETLQMIERHDEAIAALDRCNAEIALTKTDPAQRVPVQERMATSLFRLGRFAEAYAAAIDGAKVYDELVTGLDVQREKLRAAIDEIAGESLVEMGRGKEGATLYLLAGARHAKLPGGDPDASRDRMLAGRALALGGDAAGAKTIAEKELALPKVTAGMGVAAASVLREAGAAAAARRAFDAAAGALPPDVRETLASEEARLLVAEGKPDEARRFFANAERRLSGDDAQRPGGPQAWQTVLDWARMEEKAGDFEEAARLADRAIGHLAGLKYPVELDRGQAVFVRVMRRRFRFVDAERVAAERVKNGAPGGGLEDAKLDLALLGMELRNEAAPAALLSNARGKLQRRVMGSSGTDGELPRKEEEVVQLAASIPADEPELRRWVLRRVPDAVSLRWIDLWCGGAGASEADVLASLGDGRVLSAAVPTGKSVVYASSGRTFSHGEQREGDGGLTRLAESVHIDPTTLDEALRAAVAEGRLVKDVAAPTTFCVPLPLGPLPADLLPVAIKDGGILIDDVAVSFVNSPSELVAAAKRPKPPQLTLLRSAEQPLTTRYALCPVAPVDPKWGARILVLAGEHMNKGLDASAAVRAAKLAIREEMKKDPKRPGVPPWAAYELRGVP